MPAFLISLVARWGVPERFRKVAAWALAVVAAVALAGAAVLAFNLWLDHQRSEAVEQDRKDAKAEVAERTLEAERAANDADAKRRAEATRQSTDTKEAINDAISENPDAAKAPAGPATRAATDSLRNRAR